MVCIFIVIVVIVIWLMMSAKWSMEGETRKHKEEIDRMKTEFYNILNNFWLTQDCKYEDTCEKLKQIVVDMNKENGELEKKDTKSEEVSALSELSERFYIFGDNLKRLPDTEMLDMHNYGNINKEYWLSVKQQGKESVDFYIENCENVIQNADNDKILKIDIEQVLKCVWFYATEKPYSAKAFQKAVKVFEEIYKGRITDIDIAEFYAIKQVSGEEILREKLRELPDSKEKLESYASAFMWMNAYQSENTVLQYMFAQGMEMSEKSQNRLHALSNGGSNAPKSFEVSTDDETLYFDVSALAWKDEEYTGFFENLEFQDKKLTYSLAVRDEDKELFITQNNSNLALDYVWFKLKKIFKEEYGNVVSTELKNCIALAGNGKEKMRGILSVSKECNQMGILVHIVQIGKKLNIKFYTLFMPEDNLLMNQNQQVLSLHKKLSPSVTMWESSLKDTILMAIQQLLNTDSSKSNMDTSEDTNNPVF